jgi:undecaprenyl diphosphate synthase
MNPVNHVAVIMDGNGRWGVKNKNSRNAGHRAGLDTVEIVINHCIKKKYSFFNSFHFFFRELEETKKRNYFFI